MEDEIKHAAKGLLAGGFHSLYSDPEDAGCRSFPNVGELLPDYTVLYPRKYYSWIQRLSGEFISFNANRLLKIDRNIVYLGDVLHMCTLWE